MSLTELCFKFQRQSLFPKNVWSLNVKRPKQDQIPPPADHLDNCSSSWNYGTLACSEILICADVKSVWLLPGEPAEMLQRCGSSVSNGLIFEKESFRGSAESHQELNLKPPINPFTPQ